MLCSQLTPVQTRRQGCKVTEEGRKRHLPVNTFTASLEAWMKVEELQKVPSGWQAIWHWAEPWLRLELVFKFRGNLGKVSGTIFSLLPAARHIAAELGVTTPEHC